MRQATSLREAALPLLLPGITVSTDAEDYLPFQQLRLRRFDGKSWVGFGEILDDRQGENDRDHQRRTDYQLSGNPRPHRARGDGIS